MRSTAAVLLAIACALPAQVTTQEDHKRMMDLLGIRELRRNAANYDESKATPYESLPDPMVLNDSKRVSSAEMWWKRRRPEIVEHFDREVYGRTPKRTPKVTWEITGSRSWDTWTTPPTRRWPWIFN
jgi:hypothetical protein